VKSRLRLPFLVPAGLLVLLTLGFGAFAFTGTPQSATDTGSGIVQPAKKAAPAPSGSRAAWVKQANAICVRVDEDARALGTPQTRTELLQLLPRTLDLADAAVVELRALPAPRRDSARIARMLKLFARFVAVERRALAALQADDVAGFAQLNGQAFRLNDRGNRIARALGAAACAEGGSDDTELTKARKRHGVVVAVVYSPDAPVDRLAIAEARAGAGAADAGFVSVNILDAEELADVTVWYPVRATPSVLVFSRSEGAVNLFSGYVDRETVAQAAANASV
jgi:hypothetical protein